jgi:hypothetical protein
MQTRNTDPRIELTKDAPVSMVCFFSNCFDLLLTVRHIYISLQNKKKLYIEIKYCKNQGFSLFFACCGKDPDLDK